jgi:8-oxo-dGTP diphosphatase
MISIRLEPSMSKQRFVIFDNKPYGLRAGAIVIHDGKILLMRRVRDGQEFHVFPGGGVEQGETVQQGIVREINEETNQNVSVEAILYHHDLIDDSDQFYGLCRYVDGGEVRLNGPEANHHHEDNQYHPEWVDLSALKDLTLYPIMVRDWLIADLPAIQRGEHPFRHWRGVFERPKYGVKIPSEAKA